MIPPRSPRALAVLVAVAALATVTACGDDDDSSAPTGASETTAEATLEATEPATSEATATTGGAATETVPATEASASTEAAEGVDTTESSSGGGGLIVSAGEPFPEDRCAANQQAGKITFLTGFDFAAAASIIEVIMADDRGYYEDLCLDVELLPSFSTSNYPIVASGDAQFASGGSFGELVAFAAANEADLVGVTVDARVPIDTLIVKPGQAETLEDLSGTTIGVKGRLPTSLEVMLGEAGLAEGTDYETVLLDGFDPLAHIAIPDIVGFSGWKSNEPGTLERADVPFDTFDPVDYDVPGSFGVIFTSLDFLAEHPTAAEDFVRATLRGLADAVEDPEAAAATAVALINETGNPNFLSAEGETFRWGEEAKLIVASTPEGSPLAVPDDVSLQAELDAGAGVGLFGDSGEAPSAAASIAPDITSGVYDANGEVIWPG